MNGAYLDLARAHAPLLLVSAPLLGAALALAGAPARLSWLVGVFAAIASVIVAADFAVLVFSGAPVVLAQVGVALHVDGVGVFGAVLVTAASALVVTAGGAFLREFGLRAAPFGIALFLSAGAGWCAALFVRDWIALVVAVESAWLASVGLTALAGARDRGALNGALRMLTAGGVGSALMLLGVGLIGRAVGTMQIDALPLAQIAAPSLAGAGVALMVVALGIKAGAAPLHWWAGAALGRSGGAVALGLGAVGMMGALCVLTRVAAYAIAAPEIGAGVSAVLGVLGAASVIIGSVQAVGAQSLPRLGAYVCASQAGCVMLSIALGSPAGFAAALVQLFAFAASALALFGGASAGRVQSLSMLDGYGQRAPLASVAITVGALSLMGAPLTIGFLGRWRLVEAGVGAGWWWAAVLVIVASLAGVFFGGRLIERMYFRRATDTFRGETAAWRVALAPVLAAAIVATALGFAPGPLLHWASVASAMLTGAAS